MSRTRLQRESAGAVAFTVTLSAATTLDVSVAYETAPGTARGSADTPSGPDYATRTGTLVVPAGHTTGTIRVAVEDDGLDEPDETFTVTLRHPSNATLGDDASATGTIADDDPLPTITAAAAKARFAESDSIEVDVRLSDPSGYEVTVQYATVAGSATADEDYLAATGTLTFRAGETSDTVRVAVVNDHRHEPGGDETLLLRFQSATQAQFVGPAESIEVRISIQDDDAAQLPLASITAASPAVAEGGTVDVTVALSRAPASAVVIPVELRYAGGATGSDVSVASSALRRTFTPGGALSQTFEVGATDDTHNDDGESIRLRLRLPAGVARGDPTELTIYIADDDGAGVSVSDDAIQVPEGGSAPYRVALLASPATADGDVVVTLGGTSGSDLTVSPTALTFDASNWQTAQTVVVQAADDADALVDTPVPLTHVAAGPGYPRVRGPVVVATITEDDRAQVSWSAAAVTAGEASTTASFVVELSARSTAVVSVDYRTSDGTAQAPGDYDAVSGTAQFDHLTTEKTIRVPIRDDAVDEDESETFSVTLSNSVNADLVAPQVTTGQIEDNDLPMVRASFAAEVYTVTEGGTETVTVNLDRAPERALSLALTAAELGETQRLDYHVPEALTFDADQESASFVFSAVDDFDNDDGERLVLSLTGLPPGVTVGAPETATVHIDDNDEPAVVLSHPTVRVAEGGQSEYTVALATTPSGPVVVTLDLPADSVVDVAPRSLSFTATDWATAQTVTLTVPNDDDLAEPPPMVLAHVAAGADYGGVTAALTVTVGGNDYATVSVADSAADEGSGYLAFEVALDRPAGGDVTVDYTTVGSVASAPADYEHVDGRLRFASGVARQTVRVSLVDDDVDEPDETFALALSEPRNAVFGDQRETVSAVGTIRDDDHPVVAVSFAANAYATEEGASAALLVQVDKDPGRTLVVPVVATPGAGVSAADYRAPDSVTFVAGGPLEQTFAVTAVDDMDDEADEAVTFSLSPGTGATHGAIAEAVVHLVDNDGRGIVLSNHAPRVPEGGTGTYTVALASRPSADVVVTLAVTEGADLSVTPGALNFARDAFATAQSVTLAAAADQDAVPDPPVEIGHTAVGGDYDGESAAVTATIVEAHRPTLTVADASAAEGARRIEFEVSLDVAAAGVVTVDYATSDGTATAPGDYLDSRGTLRFLPGVTTRKVHVQVRDDGVDEAVESETFTLHFGDLRNAAFPDGAESLSAVGTIEDDDLPRVAVAFGAAVAAVVEGGVPASVEVRLDKEPERSLEISLVVSGTASSSDYRIVPQTVEFAVGGALVRTVAITAPDDDYDDGGETVEIAFPRPLPPRIFAGQPDQVVVHLTDDDRRGIEVTPQPLHVDAGRERAYTVRLLTRPTVPPVVVSVGVPPDNHLGVSPDRLVFNAADWSSTKTLRLSAESVAGKRTVAIGHTAAGGDYTGLSVPVTALTRARKPTVTVAGGSWEESEGHMNFTVKLDGPGTGVAVEYATTYGRGKAKAQDFIAASGTVRFDSNETQRVIRVELVDDDVPEDDELFVLYVENATNARFPGGSWYTHAWGTIRDEDPARFRVSLDAGRVGVQEASLAEGNSSRSLPLTVRFDRPWPHRIGAIIPITKTYRGGATSTDFVDAPPEAIFVRFRAPANHFNLSIADDHLVDPGESVIFSLGRLPSGMTQKGQGRVIVHLASDDRYELHAKPRTMLLLEDAPPRSIDVRLGWQPSSPVTVEAQGWAGTDLVVSPATLTFSAARRTGRLEVSARPDADAETDDPVTLRLVSSGTSRSGRIETSVTARIADKDRPVFAAQPVAVSEGSGTAPVTVTLDRRPIRAATLGYETVAATAEAPSDYTRVSGTLTFAVGETSKTVAIPITDDDIDEEEEEERFDLVLKDAGNAELPLLVPSMVVPVTIADNDDPRVVVSLSSPRAEALEAGSVKDPLLFGNVSAGNSSTVPLGGYRQPSENRVDEVAVRITTGKYRRGYVLGGIEFEMWRFNAKELYAADNAGNSAYQNAADQELRSVPIVELVPGWRGNDERIALTLDPGVDPGDYDGALVRHMYRPPPGTALDPGTAYWLRIRLADESYVLGESHDPLPTVVEVVADGQRDDGSLRDWPPVEWYHLARRSEERATSYRGSVRMRMVGWPDQGAEVTASLDRDPERTLEIPLTSAPADGADAADYYGVPAVVTFEAGVVAQAFRVGATDDDVDDDDEAVQLGFGELPPRVTSAGGLKVALIDDDVIGIDVDVEALVSNEGDEARYTVALTSEPSAAVTVTIDAGSDPAVAVVPATLTFQPAAWRTRQTVVVRSEADDDALSPEAATSLTHTATGGDYTDVAAPVTVTVRVVDTTLLVLSFDETDFAVDESGQSVTLTVRVDQVSDRDVGVGIYTEDWTATGSRPEFDGDYGSYSERLTFEAGGTLTQTLSIDIHDDGFDEEDEAFDVFLAAPQAGEVKSDAGSVRVTINDDDLPQLRVAFGGLAQGPLPPKPLIPWPPRPAYLGNLPANADRTPLRVGGERL